MFIVFVHTVEVSGAQYNTGVPGTHLSKYLLVYFIEVWDDTMSIFEGK